MHTDSTSRLAARRAACVARIRRDAATTGAISTHIARSIEAVRPTPPASAAPAQPE